LGGQPVSLPIAWDSGVLPDLTGAVVIASAWQPRRGRKVELEESPSIANAKPQWIRPRKFPPNVSPRYACLETRLVDPSDRRPAGKGACSVLSFIATLFVSTTGKGRRPRSYDGFSRITCAARVNRALGGKSARYANAVGGDASTCRDRAEGEAEITPSYAGKSSRTSRSNAGAS
jgi:hypothetical protein